MGNCLKCFNQPAQTPAPTLVKVTNTQQTPGSASASASAPAPTAEEVTKTQQTPGSASASAPAPTVKEVIDDLKAVLDTADLNEFVHIIKQQLEEKNSDRASTNKTAEENNEKKGMWTSFVTSGAKFLKFVNGHTEKIEDKKDIFYSGNSPVVAEILEQIGQLHWAVGGLVVAAYVIEKFDKVAANKVEAFELLSKMVDLATTIIDLREVIHEEQNRLDNAVMRVVQASIMCVSQIHSEKIFSFLKTSVNAKNLKEMSNTLNDIYIDLNLVTSKTIAKRQLENAEKQSKVTKRHSMRQSEIKKRQPTVLPLLKPSYPEYAVGIQDAQEEVIKLLNTITETETVVVVIYGFGGIGKTTLANAVLAELDLDGYNYARVHLNEDKVKNDLKEMQQQILQDAFPSFHEGASIKLRDCQDGQDRLKEAFVWAENEPIFLFIDNALRSEDLKQLPKGSRILLTTRKLDQTDVFLPLTRRSFAMKTLKKEDAENILCKDRDKRELIKGDMERILRICGGVPLALKIVNGHLVKMGYNARKCSQILDALEQGGHVEEEKMSERVINFVYNELEDGTKDAFLDICWFFNGWIGRHVEYVVGAQEVQSLVEAALLTAFVDNKDMDDFDYGGEERLNVHDIVRAKGRAMSASTRFTDVESFQEAAQDETKLNATKGLWFDRLEEHVVDVKHLNSMSHSLRILHLGMGTRTSAQSPMKFKEVRYLYVWMDTPHLPMKVEGLDMLGWMAVPTNGMSVKQLPNRLSYLWIDDLNSMESSSTQAIQNHSVEELYLYGWGGKMKQVPEGLHQLSSLKILSLILFDETEEFPEQVCNLSSLTKLYIFGWARLKRLPQSFGRLQGLTHLQIRCCSDLEEVPSSFGELTALEHLNLSSCPKLKQQLPGGLESLKYLNVYQSPHSSVESYQRKPDLRIVRRAGNGRKVYKQK